MAAEKALAIVLRVVDFSETSVVVTLFSREFGKLRGLAKGARRPKGPFESALDLLSLCRVVFLPKSHDALDLLTEAKLERRFRPRDRDLPSLYAGYYLAELLNELTDDRDPHPELFDAADQTLTALAHEAAAAAWILRFELTALRVLGHSPSWEQCVECGTEVATSGRVAFSPLAGGVLCDRCRGGKKQVISVSAGVIRVLAAFANPGDDAWHAAEIASGVRGELRAVMNHYLAHLLGKPLQLAKYLGRPA